MSRRFGFAVAAACILAGGDAGAEDTVMVSVHTTILPVCQFSAAVPQTGESIPAGQLFATQTITYRCTSGVAPSFAITASVGCPGCSESASMPVIVSDSRAVGQGMGSGRDLTLIVAGPLMSAPVQTALNTVSITVSP